MAIPIHTLDQKNQQIPEKKQKMSDDASLLLVDRVVERYLRSFRTTTFTKAPPCVLPTFQERAMFYLDGNYIINNDALHKMIKLVDSSVVARKFFQKSQEEPYICKTPYFAKHFFEMTKNLQNASDLVKDAFEKYVLYNPQANYHDYNQAMSAARTQKDFPLMETIYQEASRKKQCNSYTFNIMMRGLIDLGRYKEVYQVFEEAKKKGQLDALIFSSFILAASKNEDFPMVIKIYREAKEINLISFWVFLNFIEAAKKENDYELIRLIFEDIKSFFKRNWDNLKNNRIEGQGFFELMKTYLRYVMEYRDFPLVEEIYSFNVQYNVLNQEHLFEILSGYAACGALDKFHDFYKRIVKMASYAVRNFVLETVGEFLQFDLLQRLYTNIVRFNNDTQDTHHLFLRGAGICNSPEEALKIINSAVFQKNFEPTQDTYFYLLSALGKSEYFPALQKYYLEAMEKFPSVELTNEYMKQLGRMGKFEIAFETFEKMTDISERTFALILPIVAMINPQKLQEIYEEGMKLFPKSTVIVNGYLEALLRVKNFEKIETIFDFAYREKIDDFSTAILYVEGLCHSSLDLSKRKFYELILFTLNKKEEKLIENTFDFRDLKLGVAKLYLEEILSRRKEDPSSITLITGTGPYCEQDPFFYQKQFMEHIRSNFPNFSVVKGISPDQFILHKSQDTF